MVYNNIYSLWMINTWWRHQIETFSALLALCAGNSPVTGEFPSQRPVTRNFDVFFDRRPNKRFSKQSRPRWFETPSCSLWHHCNGLFKYPWSILFEQIACNTIHGLATYSMALEICTRFCCALFSVGYTIGLSGHVIKLPMFFRVTSLLVFS